MNYRDNIELSARIRSVQFLLSPLYSSILEPNLDLSLSEIKRSSEIVSFSSNHVLLPFKLLFKSFELFWGKNCSYSLGLSLFEIPGFAVLVASDR